MSVYIEPVVGGASVDHMVPKSAAWDKVYEWSNYRLACPMMNSRKGAVSFVLDPFEIEDGWFTLELVRFQVMPGAGLAASVMSGVGDCINRLRLNDRDCRSLREDYAVTPGNADHHRAFRAAGRRAFLSPLGAQASRLHLRIGRLRKPESVACAARASACLTKKRGSFVAEILV